MSLKKFARAPNYREEEKTLLVSVVTAYLGAIRNKKTDYDTTKAKEDAWEVIFVDYNAKSERHRSKESLKTCYENLKRSERRAKVVKANPMAKGGDIQRACSIPSKLLSTELPELVKPRPKRPSRYAQVKQQEADDAAKAASKSQDAVTVPQAEAAGFMKHFLEGSDVPAGVVVEPDDGWPPSCHIKRSLSPRGFPWQPLDYVSARLDETRPDNLDEVRLEMMREDARRKRTREDDDYATRKRVEQDEADIRLQILKTELLIKKEVLKQEIKKTSAMDRMEV